MTDLFWRIAFCLVRMLLWGVIRLYFFDLHAGCNRDLWILSEGASAILLILNLPYKY